MAKPFKTDYHKGSESKDIFSQPKRMNRQEVFDEKRKDRLKSWITFFRRNPHRFISDYFGIVLYPYQVVMIWCLQRSNLAYIVSSRGSAKSFIIGVYSLALAVLYPGMQIIICAKTLKQGGIIISEKIAFLRDRHPNVAREIRSLTSNQNTYEVLFQNGSTIRVVPSSESARGKTVASVCGNAYYKLRKKTGKLRR